MEIFGLLGQHKREVKVILASTDLLEDREILKSFSKYGLLEQKEHFLIKLPILHGILVELESEFMKLYESLEAELLNPKVDKSSKRYKFFYRKEKLEMIDPPVEIFQVKESHLKLLLINSYIKGLRFAVKHKLNGFIYVNVLEIREEVMPLISHLKMKINSDFEFIYDETLERYKGQLQLMKEKNLIEINGNHCVLTHKCLFYFFDDQMIKF